MGSLPLLPRDLEVFEIPSENEPKLSLSLSLPYDPLRICSSGAWMLRESIVFATAAGPLLTVAGR